MKVSMNSVYHFRVGGKKKKKKHDNNNNKKSFICGTSSFVVSYENVYFEPLPATSRKCFS